MMNSAIGAEIEEQCPQSLPTEKRKHAEVVGDNGSLHSKPIPTEKRNCVEIVEQPPESLPPIGEGEQNVCECKDEEEGEEEGAYQPLTYDELPAHVQRRLYRFRERFGPNFPKSARSNTDSDGDGDEMIGG